MVKSPPSSRRVILTYILIVVVSYPVLNWVLGGSGPIPWVNGAIDALTRSQALVSAGMLRVLGEPVRVRGTLLAGSGFVCNVAQGCNGMSAVTLLLAGLMGYPTAWRRRLLGLAALVPAILVVNMVRIAGLYWSGVHHRERFVDMHVYVGQVFVIVLTVGLWLAWLSWVSRRDEP